MQSTVTILFTDIEESTAHWEASADMGNMVRQHFEMLGSVVDLAGGMVFSNMGDGVAAAFPSVEAAINAAIDAQIAMAGSGLRIRIGLHTGEPEIVDGELRGRPLNRAARVMAAGHGGQILMSDLTARLARSGRTSVELFDLGLFQLRGLREPERVWQVVHPLLQRVFPPLRTADRNTFNLPLMRSSFLGRCSDVDEVGALIREQTLVTLTGVGGVGKTRLAVQVAAEEQSGFQRVVFVPLDCTDGQHADDVAASLALAMNVEVGKAPIDTVASAISGDPVLIVLDNCEHLVEAAATFVDRLITACPQVRVLATSREPLGLAGEQVCPVSPLSNDVAVQLFIDRAVAAGARRHTLDADVGTARRICALLDGVPLAIELAASRVPVLGTAAVVDALEERADVSNPGRRRPTDRHHTMRAAVDWSYRLLDPVEQRVLECMAVFSGGFELDAARFVAQRLCRATDVVDDIVAALARKSMLEVTHQPTGVRYHMLRTVRAFALDMLELRGETGRANLAMAEWLATVTDLPLSELSTADMERASMRLEREVDNWRAALRTATRMAAPDFVGRLCGAATAYALLGRADLVEDLRAALQLSTTGAARCNVLCTASVAAIGSTDLAALQAWRTELQQLEAHRPSGAGGLLAWLAHAWDGGRDEGVTACLAAFDDRRVPDAARHLLLGIAVIDRFSLTSSTERRAALREQCLDVAARCDAVLPRVTCRLGAAWTLVHDEPVRALDLAQQALDEFHLLPTYLQRMLPGNASRLLATIDPLLAASHLRERIVQLDGRDPDAVSRSSAIELLPALHGALMLHRMGHPLAPPALATLRRTPVANFISYFGYDDAARAAARDHAPMPFAALIDELGVALAPEQVNHLAHAS
jgi:predicted ATPase/class 3 adenylate cyclase